MGRYRDGADQDEASARPSRARAVLRHVDAALKATLGALDRSRYADAAAWDAALGEIERASLKLSRAADAPHIGGRQTRDEFIGAVAHWSALCEHALADLLKDAGARTPDNHIDRLLREALAVFAAAGGIGKYSADAAEFLRAVCGLVGYRVQSSEALMQRLK